MRTPRPVGGQDEFNSWSDLSSDIVELVLSKLPEACVFRAAIACKRWQSVTQMPTFTKFYMQHNNSRNRMLFTVNGVKYSLTETLHESFRFQPVETSDTHDPIVSFPECGEISTFQAAGGLRLAFTGTEKTTTVFYKLCLVEKNWRVTSEMPYTVQDPIVGVVRRQSVTEDGGFHWKLIFAGGVELPHEADDDLVTSIYDEQTDSWEYCEPLPSEFRGSSSSIFMACVVHKNMFYVYDMYSGYVSRLDMESKQWSAVKVFRPSAEVIQVVLVSRSDGLYLVGVQNAFQRDFCFNVWNIKDELEKTMRVGELVHSCIILNARPGRPSAIMRLASFSLETLWSAVGIAVLLFIQLIIFCQSVTTWAVCLLLNLIRSANINVRITSSHPAQLEGRRVSLIRIPTHRPS